jgi:ATP-binding cassette, subfamily G (WHITE), member 2, PDR
MTRLQRHPSNFFIFFLFTFAISLTMKAFFRGLAASFTQQAQAQAIAGLGILVLVIYTGFTIPTPSMIGALKWYVADDVDLFLIFDPPFSGLTTSTQ